MGDFDDERQYWEKHKITQSELDKQRGGLKT